MNVTTRNLLERADLDTQREQIVRGSERGAAVFNIAAMLFIVTLLLASVLV